MRSKVGCTIGCFEGCLLGRAIGCDIGWRLRLDAGYAVATIRVGFLAGCADGWREGR